MSVGDDGVRLNEALLLGFIYRLAGVGNHRCVSISAPFSFLTFLLGEQKKSKKYHLHPGNNPAPEGLPVCSNANDNKINNPARGCLNVRRIGDSPARFGESRYKQKTPTGFGFGLTTDCATNSEPLRGSNSGTRKNRDLNDVYWYRSIPLGIACL
jgi:hypothetical protein